MPEPERPILDASTRYCGVYGHPIRHSASPAMQNAGMACLRLNWRYLAFDVLPENLSAAINGARQMGFIGLNLTVPHKLLAVSLVDHLDESARKWGAVNTVLFEGRDSQGVWKPLRDFHETAVETRAHGFNTDADAIVRSLREDLRCEPNGASILVLGAGGAGRTAALRLADEGARRLWLVNRTRSKAEEVASEIGRRSPGVEVHVGYPTDRVDLVLNATSLGLGTADPLPFEADQFDLRNTSAVYDMIYRPAETPLLALARTRGCRTANGLGMLLYQGARALEIWTGQTAPIAEMRRALEANVYG